MTKYAPLHLVALLVAVSACSGEGDATLGTAGQSLTSAYEVKPFDVPESMGTFTSVFGINNRCTLTGNYAPIGEEVAHGFLYERGVFADIMVPGAAAGSLGHILDNGTAIGAYSDADDVSHTYLRDRHGTFTFVVDPLADAQGTDATGLNSQGTITGTLFDADGITHGFIQTEAGATIYDHPLGSRTRLFSINNKGQIVGQYFDAANVRHGFMLDGETLVAIDVPGSTGTATTAINDHGQVVGFYRDEQFVVHGFLLDHGEFTTIDFPGSSDTRLTDINELGVITGTYDFFSRGMVALPPKSPCNF